jgi:hypothetical protein
MSVGGDTNQARPLAHYKDADIAATEVEPCWMMLSLVFQNRCVDSRRVYNTASSVRYQGGNPSVFKSPGKLSGDLVINFWRPKSL